MIIEFYSRSDMRKMLTNKLIDFDKEVVICINDTVYEYNEMLLLLENNDPTGENFLILMFKDDDESFSLDQAKDVLAFMKKHGHKKEYRVSCFAGISRSGAIAKFINEYFAGDNWYLDQYKGYNRHVFNMMNKSAGTSLAAFYEELEKEERRHKWED